MKRRSLLPEPKRDYSWIRTWLLVSAGCCLAVAAGFFAWGRYKEANPEPYDFGDGGLELEAARHVLEDTTQALISDALLTEARTSGDPYYLVTRLAEWNTDGWYRLGEADEKAWGVAVTDEGAVVVAREVPDRTCVAMRVRFNSASYASDGTVELVPLPEPVVEEASFDMMVDFDPCDPARVELFDWQAR